MNGGDEMAIEPVVAVLGGDRSTPWKRRLRSIRGPQRPVLASLAEGGVRGDAALARAHDVVAVHAPSPTSRLRELYIKTQYLLLPGVADSYRRFIEDDVITAAAIVENSVTADPRSSPTSDAKKQASAMLSERAHRTEHCIAEQAETRALRYYAHGLARATIYCLVLLILIAISTSIILRLIYDGQPPRDVYLALYDSIVAIGGGAAGAALSVLLRKTDSIGEIDDQSLARAAVIRVTLGCIFAAALIFLVRGDIFTAINVPSAEGSGIRPWFFWGGMGFLAGFNERWVRHVITRTPDDETKKPADPQKPDSPAPAPTAAAR